MKRRIISRVWNRYQGYLKSINGFPTELEFSRDDWAQAHLFRSMHQAKKWIMTRPIWIIYSVERVDTGKRICFKKWSKS